MVFMFTRKTFRRNVRLPDRNMRCEGWVDILPWSVHSPAYGPGRPFKSSGHEAGRRQGVWISGGGQVMYGSKDPAWEI